MERWKDIKDYEGFYQVSNFGNIKSLDRYVDYSNGRKALHKGRVKSQPTDCKTEYRTAVLSKGNRLRSFKISRLVAKAFVSNPDNLPVVNHIDGDKMNDHHTNLEWCTYSHNTIHAFDNGLNVRTSKYTGVCWDKSRGKFAAYKYRGNKNIFLGRFSTDISAAQAVKEYNANHPD